MSPHLTTVDFHDDTLFAVERPEGVFVAIKPISDRLGLDWSAQLRRTKRDPLLAQGMVEMTIPSPGGPQATACLPLRLLPGWLFGIGTNQVRPEAREAVLAYQSECHEVLFRHFHDRHNGAGTTPPLPAPEPVSTPLALQMVTEARRSFGVQASRRLWLQLGLPVVAGMTAPPAQGDLFPHPAAGLEPASDEAAAG